MYLKSLTLSGFKSFGRTTAFEFPAAVTAIVGPNGSGKSNVAEAVRWVLGEQSMKSLRGKRGEDLIFNGSEKTARLGRAEVKLVFDNSHKRFPFEFDDVVIARRVMRDGTNEYVLNGSVVRLKDIFELLSKVGLGSTQHHIISQGEVDRILWASSKERQEMIEEALGLKEFHLKEREAERKLAETETNMKQVEAQRREIQPHLKFLAAQAQKMKAHERFANELEEKIADYASRERATLEALREKFEKRRLPLENAKKEKEKRIIAIQAEIQREEKEFSQIKKTDDSSKAIEELEDRRRAFERELGKLEGMLAGEAGSAEIAVPVKTFVRTLRETVSFVDDLMAKDSFESLKSGLKDVKLRLEEMERILAGEEDASSFQNLGREREMLTQKLHTLEENIRALKAKKEEDQTVREDIITDLREREHRIREEERELEVVTGSLREIGFAEAGFRTREAEWKTFVTDSKIDVKTLHPAHPFADDGDRHTGLRTIERLRIKLEEAGGIDSSVVKEHEETQTRDAFLSRELEDLMKAKRSLVGLMKELEAKLKEQFTGGLKQINTEFQNLFKQIFGGGKASLAYIPPKVSEDENGGRQMVEGGVEISLDIPRKRLRSLDMLSGGERALTSIALLFAISSVNPPPFLVLDETDAALDEANSQRYGDLLSELAKKTQLILITHNRQTMNRAEVLYGVTMGADGISKILSLKLEEAKELAGVEN